MCARRISEELGIPSIANSGLAWEFQSQSSLSDFGREDGNDY